MVAQLSLFYDPASQNLTEVFPFRYHDGTTSPPLLLRTFPDQNYLSGTVRKVGLSLMSVALAAVILSALWIFLNRGHRLIVAAQPAFLYLICLGSILLALVILLSSFDESHGWTTDQLDRACLAIPWVDSMGHIFVYGALFTKVRC